MTDRVTDKMGLILKILSENPSYSYDDLVNKTKLSRKQFPYTSKD